MSIEQPDLEQQSAWRESLVKFHDTKEELWLWGQPSKEEYTYEDLRENTGLWWWIAGLTVFGICMAVVILA